MTRQSLAAALVIVLACGAAATPLSVKEIDLLLRMKVSDEQILKDVESRRLLSPIDPAAEQQLRASGATPVLLERLKTGNFTLSAELARAAVQRDTDQKAAVERARAADAQAFAQREKQRTGTLVPAGGKLTDALASRLVKMDASGRLQQVAADTVRPVRLYALYYSAHWCGPCRKFTPELVSFYNRFKPQHPEVELVFISADRDVASMEKYMREAKMPWPAVRFDRVDGEMRQWSADGIPYLVLVNAAGEPVMEEGRKKRYVDPRQVIAALEKAAQGS